jgi:RNA polymerase sigma-70 factor (ECF subfamily)
MVGWGSAAARTRDFEEAALVHLDVLHRTALRLTHNRAEAADLVQETCFKAFRSFHRFNPGTNCRAWLLTILRNTYLNRVRSAQREVLEAEAREAWPAAGPGGDEPSARESPEEEFFRTVLHGDVDRALKALPLAFREAIVLVDLEGLSYREAADVVGCPIGTVMSRLARGRGLLRRALGELAREHGWTREATE